jgi:hypothetical protein
MHDLKPESRNIVLLISSLLFSIILIMLTGCRNTSSTLQKIELEKNLKQTILSEDNTAYLKFRSFQNSDSTWGFTIFLNSRPYLHVKKVPARRASTGFRSRKDAENVAELFVEMIREGDMTPKLNRKTIDSLGLIINVKR